MHTRQRSSGAPLQQLLTCPSDQRYLQASKLESVIILGLKVNQP
jgi:hypothetical protein